MVHTPRPGSWAAPQPMPHVSLAEQHAAYEQGRQEALAAVASQNSQKGKDVEVGPTGIWMDYKTLAGVIAIACVGMWQFNAIQWEIKDLRTSVSQLSTQFNASVKTISEGIIDRLSRVELDATTKEATRYTKIEHDTWCLKTEKLNAQIGWQCAPLERYGTAEPQQPPYPSHVLRQNYGTEDLPRTKNDKTADADLDLFEQGWSASVSGASGKIGGLK